MRTFEEQNKYIEDLIEELKNNPSKFSGDLIKILKNEDATKKYVETKAVSIIYNVLEKYNINDEYLKKNKIETIINDLNKHLFLLDSQVCNWKDSIDNQVIESIYDNEILSLDEDEIKKLDYLNETIKSILIQALENSDSWAESLKIYLKNKFKENSKEILDFLLEDLNNDIEKAKSLTRKEVDKTIKSKD